MMKPKYKILKIDPYLEHFSEDIELRMNNLRDTKKRVVGNKTLSEFANGHKYFGFHQQQDGWFFREWAPNAREVYLFGDFNEWNRASHPLKKLSNGVWEIFIEGKYALPHRSKVRLIIKTDFEVLERIPVYCKRVIQNPENFAFDGQVWNPERDFVWTDEGFSRDENEPLLIYETHIGMSGEKYGISTYSEFTDFVLPRAKRLGYNAIQVMAVLEHPYYGSFGYQVSNFFAVSSRFGEPEDFKRLVNTAHEMGLSVLLDLVHSHAVNNEVEGLGRFDGTVYQYFHDGDEGNHPQWGTKLFDYGKPEVIHFLLSNLKFWLEEYHLDGFRFDGVTSMLYRDHGLGGVFDNYKKYFSMNTDTEAVTYLQLAALTCKEVKPDCIIIAEDMSGMPGMCLPVDVGGIGFDYRLGMGVPDFWINTLKKKRDEDWDMGQLWHELNQRRPQEKVIGYCESHDQALVGDKTIMFWLADKEMYWHMDKNSNSEVIDRALSLHKMIRLITCVCAGEGYLNFMGNEFGHPEWVDFPREGNGNSYHYARRQWSLADNPHLKYGYLQEFDKAMIELVRFNNISNEPSKLIYIDQGAKVLIFSKGRHLCLFNFHHQKDYHAKIACKGKGYKTDFYTNEVRFGGHIENGGDAFISIKGFCDIIIDRRSAIVCHEI